LHAAPRILVLRHPDDLFDRTSYVIRALIEEWRRRGMTVDVSDNTNQTIDDGTIVIPHLDLTRTPPAYERFLARCPHVVNRAVLDISKRRISRNLVTSPRAFDGAVIVKPNQNACGEPERSKLRRSGRSGWMLSKALKRLPWTLTAQIGSPGYRIYDHARQVPWLVWRNPRLVVEKFLPERQGDQYCLRQYVFFGNREINTLAVSPDPIVKAWNVTRRELLSETPPALREIRAKLGFDFGKFDYVMRDGEVILFDTNRTPTYNAASKAGSPSQLVLDLALGIEAFTAVAA
jgi:hypothetical protein